MGLLLSGKVDQHQSRDALFKIVYNYVKNLRKGGEKCGKT